MRSPEGAAQSASRGLQRRVATRIATMKISIFYTETDDPNNGIWVDKEFIKANCAALRDMIADFGETQEVKIPIGLISDCSNKVGF